MKKILKFLLVISSVIVIGFTNIKAASGGYATLNGNTTVEVGKTVTITAIIGGDNMYMAVGNVSSSNSSVLSGGGQMNNRDINGLKNVTKSFTFTANKVGTATVTLVVDNENTINLDGESYSIGPKSLTITVVEKTSGGSGSSGTTTPSNPTVNYSKDNNLKSLTISEGTLSPAFSASTTSYTVELASTVTSLKVDAVANDSKASVKGTGTKELEPGENTIKITVTAENGNPKVYTITAIVDETPLVFLPYEGNELGVVRNIKNVKEPNGFEQTKVKVNGNDTIAWKSSKSDVTLLYLQNGNDKDFYVYDGTNVVSVYQPLNGIGKNLAYVGVPSELQERSGMTFGDVTIKDLTLKGWTYNDSELSNYSVIYAMNEFGEYNYYQYESSENTLQLYPNASLISQEEFDEIVKENELIKDEKDSMTMYFYIACGVAVVTSIFGIVGFVNANKYKNRLLTRNRFSESND